jgi:hypothetical protein
VIAGSLRRGFTEAARRSRITLGLYLLNLIAAAVLTAPLLVALDAVFGRSEAARGLDSTFNFEALLDFIRSHEEFLQTHFQTLGVGAIFYAIASAVLTGGTIDTLKGPQRSPFLPRFFGGCGRFALRFVRLLAYLAVALWALYWLSRGIDRAVVLAFDESAHEVAAFWAMRGKQGLMLLVLLLLASVFDLARILTVLENRAHMIGALLTAAGFVARHVPSILGLYAFLLGAGLLLFVPYLFVAHHLLPATSIFGLLVVQQLVILLRHFLRVAGFASLLSFYRSATGEPPSDRAEKTTAPSAEGTPPAGGRLPAGVAPTALVAALLTAASVSTSPALAAAARGASPAEAKEREPLSRRVVSYRIEASLDTGRHTVVGRETIAYRNDTRIPMTDLKLHLYPNAFSNTRSTFMRGIDWEDEETRTRLERMAREETWGSMRIASIRIAGGPDLASRTSIDDTVMTVSLPSPVAPGDTARVEIAWETLLPRTFDRMGHWGDHYDVMQWFPKPAVFTNDGWKVYPFYRNSEFFADFGTFEVTLTVPEEYRLEATGVPGEARSNPDGTRSVIYRAEDVHDFAWIADPRALMAREVYRDGPYAAAPVEILYVHPPCHARMAPRVLAAAKEGLRYYGERLMPYPYPRLVIDGLPMGLGGGMEYPMLFTVSLAWFLPQWYSAPEELTLHEFGHQYWYGIVATNEFEEPWLDEGINSYVTRQAIERWLGAGRPGRTVNALFTYAAARILREGLEIPAGPWSLDFDQLLGFHETPFRPIKGGFLGYRVSPFQLELPGLDRGEFLGAKNDYARAARDNPLLTPSWGFKPGSYSPIVYDKTDVALETVARVIGRDVLDETLREYVRRFRFKHPASADFFSVLVETTARTRPDLDLRPYIDQLFRGTGTIDYAVTSLESRPVTEVRGYLPAARAGEPSIDRRAPAGPEERKRYETEVIVERLGEVALPVEILVRFEGGEEIREAWDGRETWRRLLYERDDRAEKAVVDPDRIYAMDLDRNNNGLNLERQPRPLARLACLWLFWLQNYLHLTASLS